MNNVICLMGPTACGKSELALKIFNRIPCEIVSIDSVMIYRGLDIGSAKPSKALLSSIPHHLIDVRDASETYSGGQFYRDVESIIDGIITRGKLPLLVGGTMMYFNILFSGIAQLPQADQVLRNHILLDAQSVGWPALHAQLAHIDVHAAKRIKPNDGQRIQRALEVYHLTGKTLTELQQQSQRSQNKYNILKIALSMERPHLHQRIAKRFHQMLHEGLIDEVQTLFKRDDLRPDLPAIRSVGYREVWHYLANRLTYNEMQERAVISTRQLAKRQCTWLRSFNDVHWFEQNGNNHYSLDHIENLIIKTFRHPVTHHGTW